ncbi:hypothetical protein, partial [Actinobaculum suis]|uniref:hypothetical protein n=1 Tax=Actinobaculum suis TaxID=1657 RepID=UPI00163B75F3
VAIQGSSVSPGRNNVPLISVPAGNSGGEIRTNANGDPIGRLVPGGIVKPGQTWTGMDAGGVGERTYWLVDPTTGQKTKIGTINGAWPKRHEIRSLDGRYCIPFRWEGPHKVEGDLKISQVWPAGAAYPVLRTSGDSPAQPFTVHAVPEPESRNAWMELIRRRAPVMIIHSRAACHRPECPLLEDGGCWLAQIVAAPREMSARFDRGEETYQLDCVPVDPASLVGLSGGIAPNVWRDLPRLGTVERLRAARSTWRDVLEHPIP